MGLGTFHRRIHQQPHALNLAFLHSISERSTTHIILLVDPSALFQKVWNDLVGSNNSLLTQLVTPEWLRAWTLAPAFNEGARSFDVMINFESQVTNTLDRLLL